MTKMFTQTNNNNMWQFLTCSHLVQGCLIKGLHRIPKAKPIKNTETLNHIAITRKKPYIAIVKLLVFSSIQLFTFEQEFLQFRMMASAFFDDASNNLDTLEYWIMTSFAKHCIWSFFFFFSWDGKWSHNRRKS